VKILQICHRVPYPPLDGGNIAMQNMAEGLAGAGAEVHQFALNTNKHFVDPDSLPERYHKVFHFQSVPIRTDVTLSGALLNFFRRNESYNLVRFYNEDAARKIAEILREGAFDLVQLETLFAAPYLPVIRANSQARIVLRAHNVEHVIWKRLQDAERRNPLKRWYLGFLSRRLKREELRIFREVDAIVPITDVDEGMIRQVVPHKQLLTIPLGVDLREYPEQDTAGSPLRLFHLGSMDWLPNLEAVNWFLGSCWPKVHQQFPQLELHLAGRGFPDSLLHHAPEGVRCSGTVADAQAYMRDKQIMVVPLLSGSGMRVKIIQGMALGKTVISTSIGAEGIDVKDGEHLLIADTPAMFLEKIRYCVEHPDRCRSIGKAARQLVEERYACSRLGKRLIEFYSRLN
jgi:glycosyltransferase involved in cell wall biosynthesis